MLGLDQAIFGERRRPRSWRRRTPTGEDDGDIDLDGDDPAASRITITPEHP